MWSWRTQEASLFSCKPEQFLVSSICDAKSHHRINIHLTCLGVPFVGHYDIFENVGLDVSIEELLCVLVIGIGSSELISKLDYVSRIHRELRHQLICEQRYFGDQTSVSFVLLSTTLNLWHLFDVLL